MTKHYGKVFTSYIRSIFLAFIALYFLLYPATILIQDLQDPGLKNGQMPQFTYRWHRSLSEGFASWANDRVVSRKASKVTYLDISATEWPMFSAVFYLWATESLQNNWQKDQSSHELMPKEYAEKSIQAAIKLIIDPDNASWVIEHWGENYLQQENLFYRMLLIAGLTSYQKITADAQYQPLLQEQVDSLSAEIEASPYGLLDDYPGQCFPIDILPAIAVIKRADDILGTDHSEFVQQSIRAFQDSRLDIKTGLPSYRADSRTGQGYGDARGVGLSLMLIWSPELWPDVSQQWYEQYEKQFWNNGLLISGFYEFSRNKPVKPFFFEIDAGPVVAGYGTAANGFGLAAARVNNKIQQAYPLATEALVASWPLPDGTLLMPKLLSNFTEAPYLGEAALLFAMTREKVFNNSQMSNVSLPYFVYLFLLFYILTGMACLITAMKIILNLHRTK